ncbi:MULTISPECIES: isovaleryl-CoA dehydrogenase [Pandoraea]|uniref:DNA alkylation response protein n=1 Tax=Pandoraea thiooxydans TaxID=445709 RepID=A0A0G3ER46_9BURK|nr:MULTISPECIES: isovaleryl-CoA dehydrogenase [Pandoraea]AKJ69538.1 DNA alkylation response protein [Pandoraea thiooxydans]APR97224.1 acyl-CoA dehydrogenase [Pandoraea thiooxydans]TAL57279.1 MAG: isovaleryl-CoA dehydrogenase [Pandoraea sp.]TAM16473.1 MAG: isovaleryl-CoA dehydrogenase [Pandoraea sp.]
MSSPWTTHQVENQVPMLENYDLYGCDALLGEAVERHGAGWHAAELQRFGARLGQTQVQQWADEANHHLPELVTHDPQGRRIDRVDFHPSWHALLGLLRGEGLHALPWSAPGPGAMAARAAGYFLHGQVEAGTLCPTTMTFASIPVLAREPALFAQLQDKLFAREHDARDLPLAQKRSVLIGMGMTEKQGGSDVRTNTTRATPLGPGGRGGAYALVGHKWFFSAPMCDAHLVLARTTDHDALSCFFVPRFKPDGQKNPVQIQRLKDKLGNRSNASSEVEFLDAYGVMVGDEGRGIPTILEMATYTRLDCVIGSAALMRQSLVQAIHHARHRRAFGQALIAQPLMRNVLTDLALESAAATLLMMQLAAAFDRPDDPVARAWRRILLPAAKFWVCKRALEFAGESMEVWGGNGYVETGPMARLYREAPVNSIWEGSGNIMCLDVLRAVQREPELAHALLDALDDQVSGHAALKAALADLRRQVSGPPETREAMARHIAQQWILLAQAGLMLAHAPSALAGAFLASRFEMSGGRVYGTLPADVNQATQEAILARAFAP